MQHVPPKHWYSSMKLHDFTSQKTTILDLKSHILRCVSIFVKMLRIYHWMSDTTVTSYTHYNNHASYQDKLGAQSICSYFIKHKFQCFRIPWRREICVCKKKLEKSVLSGILWSTVFQLRLAMNPFTLEFLFFTKPLIKKICIYEAKNLTTNK
jgi:hypothetical protein